MFQDAIQIFETYKKSQFSNGKLISNYETEISKRLRQLSWLISNAERLNQNVLDSLPKITDSHIKHRRDAYDLNSMFELEIYTESFYHFSWRIIEIIDKHENYSSSKLKRSKVLRVRNNLVQHPEKQKEKEKSFPMFSTGDHNGPTIKGYIGPDMSYEDEGLFVNAKDFIDRFIETFEKKNT